MCIIKKESNMIVFIVTFCLFTIEALLHYNHGKDDKSKFHLPDKEKLVDILITVFIFSFLNSRIIKYLARHYHIH